MKAYLSLAAALGASVLAFPGAAQTFNTLYKFNATGAAGSLPLGITSANGVLYGATEGGGTFEQGVVYELQPPATDGGPWTQTVLHNFACVSDGGCIPFAPPVAGPNGALYGATEQGGPGDWGTVYVLQPPTTPGGQWAEKVLHSFTGVPDGRAPYSSVVIGPIGQIYGTTLDGGTSDWGVVFELTPPAWTEKVLYSFTNGADGGAPTATPVVGPEGALYGTTSSGGTYGNGVVYKLIPPATPGAPWTETVLYSFTDGAALRGLVIGAGGIIYGSTYGGGSAERGTVFQLTPPAGGTGGAWTETVLYDFAAAGDGQEPDSLVLHNGSIYGTTLTGAGSTNKGGSLFELQPPAAPGGAWTEIVLHNFARQGAPVGNIVLGSDGVVYGTVSDTISGSNCCGMVYRVGP